MADLGSGMTDHKKGLKGLLKDGLESITVFSARLYGSRSHKNQQLLEGVKQAVEEMSS